MSVSCSACDPFILLFYQSNTTTFDVPYLFFNFNNIRGGVGAFIDAEHALDPTYAKNIGLDVDELLVSQPDSGEMALDVVDQLVRSSAVDMVSWGVNAN